MNTGIRLIKKWEGLKLRSYQCLAGKWTIGYGNTVYENGSPVKPNEKINIDRADRLLIYKVAEFENAIKKLLKVNLNDNQIGALTSFAFNVGIGAISRSVLLKKVNANPADSTIRDEFMRWNKVNGTPVKGLTNRRKDEADLYFKL